MDFAEAAALAELEDQEQNGSGHASGHAQQQTLSQDTRSTVTDPGEADCSGLLGLRHHRAWQFATETCTAIRCAGLHTRDSSEGEHNSKRQRANAQFASL